jgi:hypothetical protein
MRAGLDGGPALFLGLGGRAKLLLEPPGNDGMKLKPLHERSYDNRFLDDFTKFQASRKGSVAPNSMKGGARDLCRINGKESESLGIFPAASLATK